MPQDGVATAVEIEQCNSAGDLFSTNTKAGAEKTWQTKHTLDEIQNWIWTLLLERLLTPTAVQYIDTAWSRICLALDI